jgi:hypothetical protein
MIGEAKTTATISVKAKSVRNRKFMPRILGWRSGERDALLLTVDWVLTCRRERLVQRPSSFRSITERLGISPRRRNSPMPNSSMGMLLTWTALMAIAFAFAALVKFARK